MQVGNFRFKVSARGTAYRTIKVSDAISDLPPIPSGCNEEWMHYSQLLTQDTSLDRMKVDGGGDKLNKTPKSTSLSHFQRLARIACQSKKAQGLIRDHCCKVGP